MTSRQVPVSDPCEAPQLIHEPNRQPSGQMLLLLLMLLPLSPKPAPSTDEAQRAYRRLALEFHPDRSADADDEDAMAAATGFYIFLNEVRGGGGGGGCGALEACSRGLPLSPLRKGGKKCP